MILTPEQVQEVERQAISGGASEETLMEEAGAKMARVISGFFPKPGHCIAVFGKGHNGGDALVVARILSECGWQVTLLPVFERARWSELTRKKWDQAGRCTTSESQNFPDTYHIPNSPIIILDGILGIGSTGPLSNLISDLCRKINALREQSNAQTIAIDLPTGLNGKTGETDPNAIIADLTLTVGFAKTGMLADGAEHFVGRIALLPLAGFTSVIKPGDADLSSVNTSESLRGLWRRRSASSHKGSFGRVLLIAGGIGTVGAAALAARGALRAGAGLVTLVVPRNIYNQACAITPAECMVRPVEDLRDALRFRADSLGIGPGLGLIDEQQILETVRDFTGPAVVDADALNMIATHGNSILPECAGPRLLTPHPGEMQRLFSESSSFSRRALVEHFTSRYPVTLLLKGARTIIGERGGRVSYNSTGNAGMACGGMGDVLTGVCAALLAQGLRCMSAAQLGAWLCGRSAEVLVSSGRQSMESLLPTDVADGLGAAFESLREGIL
jgi:NAD(P)H-hydrate epimerase